MRYLILLLALLAVSATPAQEAPCLNDMTGIQTTLNVSDRHGNPYEISSHADDARDTWHFLHAAINYLYFSNEGDDLRGEFTHYIRVRDVPILLAACNNRGQCAEIEVASRPLDWGGFFGRGVHTGFDVTARFNGTTASDFIPVDSAVYWNHIPRPNDSSMSCLNNYERDMPDIPDTSSDDGGDGNDDLPFDVDWDEDPESDYPDLPMGIVEIIDPDEDGRYPNEW
ncbi:MAG: hypothetical protein AAF660_08700 [Pseudomonadota bacterium]